jgi:ADP-ribose pyrophosphatase YjhB (NUDIX family)
MGLVEFTVAGALVESSDGLLLVRNQRRNGSLDWSTPGGVIDATDPSLLDGLAREVREETGFDVWSWEGPIYEVRATAVELGWSMRCEVYRALDFRGELRLEDPDGIVIEACFATSDEWEGLLRACSPWVREPLADWLEHRWGPDAPRSYAYDVSGAHRDDLQVVRTSPP